MYHLVSPLLIPHNGHHGAAASILKFTPELLKKVYVRETKPIYRTKGLYDTMA